MSETSPDHLKSALEALNSINHSLDRTSEALEATIETVKAGELPTEHGLTFLEVKYHLLDQYLMDLQYMMLSKCQEASAIRPSVVERLIESRVMLEKLRPVETKLKFQIDKTIKSSVITDNGEANLLQYRPRLENLRTQPDKEEEDNDDDSDDGQPGPGQKKPRMDRDPKKNIYRPPKLLAMPYEEDDVDKPKKRAEARKKAISARMVQELKEELLDTPAEITEGSMAIKTLNKEEKARTNYEESYYTRIPITKKDKKRRAQALNRNELDFEFRDIGSNKNSGSSKKRGKKRVHKRRK